MIPRFYGQSHRAAGFFVTDVDTRVSLGPAPAARRHSPSTATRFRAYSATRTWTMTILTTMARANRVA